MTDKPQAHGPYDLPRDDSALPPEERSLPEALGTEIQYAPEDLAPPVDRDRLRAFVRRKLNPGERKQVLGLIGMFRSWHLAWGEVLRETPAD